MSNSISRYIKLFEEELASIQDTGVTEPTNDTQEDSEVQVSYNQDLEGNPKKDVTVNAGGMFDGDPDELRTALRQSGVAFPDQDSQPNQSGISVSVDSDGRIFATASGEQADELLNILKNAGLYHGDA